MDILGMFLFFSKNFQISDEKLLFTFEKFIDPDFSSLFLVRIYYREVDGHWVLEMIEDGSEDLRLEVCPENVRSAEVLIPLIRKHVLPGTIIHTDYWKAYDCLKDYGYIHKKVNHSDPDNPFVAQDGTHTQRIESQWRVVKREFYNDSYSNNFANWVVEYQWRRKCRKHFKDPFNALIEPLF